MRIFFNPIEGREKYLNEMASKGYRLIKSGSIFHKFEKTNNHDRKYSVQYVGHLSNKKRIEYEDFIKNLNVKSTSAPLNIGKVTLGNVRYRPYHNTIATSPGAINKEILILECEKGKEIPVFTDKESKLEDLKNRKRVNIYTFVVGLLFMGLGLFKKTGNLYEKTYISFRPLDKYPLVWVVVGGVILGLSLYHLFRILKVEGTIKK
ncbi:MAG: DUF2812 domain-containing protein [Tissierellia bacterium]|nr:DUF2812 domain-containing protein [Tissierellia bacterium]